METEWAPEWLREVAESRTQKMPHSRRKWSFSLVYVYKRASREKVVVWKRGPEKKEKTETEKWPLRSRKWSKRNRVFLFYLIFLWFVLLYLTIPFRFPNSKSNPS